MAEKPNLKQADELIREALDRELESIEPPPADTMWNHIESNLDEDRKTTADRSFVWVRYAAAAAAACLLLVLGGIGLFRFTDLASPVMEDEIPTRTAEEVIALDAEESDPEYAVPEIDIPEIADRQAEEEVAVFESPPIDEEADPLPPDWQRELPGDFALNKTVVLDIDEEVLYHGAVYYGDEADLLWVKSKADNEDLDRFLDYLGEHLQDVPQPLEEVDEAIYFEAGEKTGLAWQEDGCNQALVIISGFVPVEKLQDIAGNND